MAQNRSQSFSAIQNGAISRESMEHADRVRCCVSVRQCIVAPAMSAALLLLMSPIHGQELKKSELRENTTSGRDRVLEEVIVTATKRDMSVRDIPQSITAMAGADIEEKGIQTVEELARLVPGVNISKPGDSAARITVRGIAAQSGTNATTGVLFGDISFTDAYLQRVSLDPNPFDLQSVEVLKGPQGTLFGAGALNGAIRYVPESPAMDLWEMKYFAQYTEVREGGDEPIYGIAANIPLANTMSLRVVGVDRRSPGWVDNVKVGLDDANWVDQSSLRGIVRWEPNERLVAELTYMEQETESIETAVADNENGELKSDNKPRLSPSSNNYQFLDFKISYNFDWATLVSDTARIDKEADNFFDASSRLPEIGNEPTTSQVDTSYSETISQEFRLVSRDNPDSDWRWVAGVVGWKQEVYYKLDLPLESSGIPFYPGIGPILPLLPITQDLVTDDGKPNLAGIETDVEIKEVAAFGDITRLIGNWELSLGGRYYRTVSGGTAAQTGILLFAVNGETRHVLDEEIKEKDFNPKISILWHATDNILAYIAASRGFRVGGVQPGFTPPGDPPAPVKFKSDSLWNYEAAIRTEWFDRALRADLTAFRADWEDPQVFQLSPSGVGSYIDNAGGVESEGYELALQYLFPFLPGLSLTTAISKTETITTEPFVGSDGNTVAAGAQWPFAPEWQSATSLAWTTGFDNWLINSAVTHTSIDKAYSDLTRANAQEVFDFEQWDFQVGLSNPSVGWLPDLTVILNNIKDERGTTHKWRSGTVDTVDVTYIRPRALTVRLSGQF